MRPLSAPPCAPMSTTLRLSQLGHRLGIFLPPSFLFQVSLSSNFHVMTRYLCQDVWLYPSVHTVWNLGNHLNHSQAGHQPKSSACFALLSGSAS
jgi:hypothetical protein